MRAYYNLCARRNYSDEAAIIIFVGYQCAPVNKSLKLIIHRPNCVFGHAPPAHTYTYVYIHVYVPDLNDQAITTTNFQRTVKVAPYR